jgi:hypothetical protein
MSVRQGIWLLLVCVTLAAASGCTQERVEISATEAECAKLATQSKVDERCAIELAKAEIVRRQGKLDYSKFAADFDAEQGAWAITAVVEPLVPGGHVFVSIARNGEVRDYTVGR